MLLLQLLARLMQVDAGAASNGIPNSAQVDWSIALGLQFGNLLLVLFHCYHYWL